MSIVPFMCLAIDKTENKERVVVDSTIVLAESQDKAKERFTIENAKVLQENLSSLEIYVCPFCR